jgi:hypothetical protein
LRHRPACAPQIETNVPRERGRRHAVGIHARLASALAGIASAAVCHKLLLPRHLTKGTGVGIRNGPGPQGAAWLAHLNVARDRLALQVVALHVLRGGFKAKAVAVSTATTAASALAHLPLLRLQ